MNSLGSNQTLAIGAALDSTNGQARLVLQGDGNLVLYVVRDGAWAPRWDSRTFNQASQTCTMQNDGNLVVYDGAGHALWASGTHGHPGATLHLQDDENLVIYDSSGVARWSSDTWVGPTVTTGFDPTKHGFRFVNNFPDAVLTVGLISFRSAGLCGGCCYAALDYFNKGLPVPTDITTPPMTSGLGSYIRSRQLESVLGSWHGSKFVALILNPDDHALHHWSTHDEWDKLKETIDAGVPLPIGLVRYLDFTGSHQVVAVGYQDGEREKRIHCYDPNHPRKTTVLTLEPGQLHWRQPGNEWRGFFVESGYAMRTPDAPRFVLQTTTPLGPTDATWSFDLASNGDLFAFRRSGNATMEVHVLSKASDYQQFVLQTATALHPVDHTFELRVADNRDVLAIKKSATGSNSTEVHVLSASSNYGQFVLQTGTALHETDHTFAFLVAGNRDLVALKKAGTGTNSTEVHVLSASSSYQQFVLQTGTALHESGAEFSFDITGDGDVFAFKKSGTGTGTTEAHVLSSSNGYHAFEWQSGTVLHSTDATWELFVTPGRDVLGVKKSGATSTEVHVLDLGW